MDTETATLTLRLPRTMHDALKCIAKAQDLTMSQVVRRHMNKYLTDGAPGRKKRGAES